MKGNGQKYAKDVATIREKLKAGVPTQRPTDQHSMNSIRDGYNAAFTEADEALGKLQEQLEKQTEDK